MVDSLLNHWPEYLIEGALLGTFMVAACAAVCVIHHPRSPVARSIGRPSVRRIIIGILMGLTAVGLIYSPWGQRSGAHMNPGTTLTFFFLGKVNAWDAVFYVCSQFVGAWCGVRVARAVLGRAAGHENVNFAATVPGKRGIRAAWIGEFLIAFGMMSMVLASTNHAASAAYTGVFAGLLVAVFIAVEAPISGMSMNPARTLGSAIHAREFRGIWIYFTAPPLAMLAAAGLHAACFGLDRVYCAKLNHQGHQRCIFNCRNHQMLEPGATPPESFGIRPRDR
jgi:aquaporin Z